MRMDDTELEQIFHGSWNILNITNNNNNNKLKVTILTQMEYENLLQVFIKYPRRKSDLIPASSSPSRCFYY